MKKNLLVTLADKNYIDQAKQLFSSVYFNAGFKGDYMLLSHDIAEKDLEWFKNKGILIKRCKPLFDKEFWYSSLPQGVLSPIVSIKFYLFTSEFKEWDNIIYLDADIIVRASLDKLTKIDGLAAVADAGSLKLKNQFVNTGGKLFSILEKEYNLSNPSFNAGVLAFSTKMIKSDTFLKLRELFEKYAAISSYSEQTILNLFFYKRWKRLLPVYNIYFSDKRDNWDLKPEKMKGIILHFIGGESVNLPWSLGNYFFPEWKNNLDRAKNINLKKIPVGKKWSQKKIIIYSAYLNFASFRLKKRNIWHVILKNLASFFGSKIGLVGIFLKNNFPKLYFSLKKLKFK